MATQTTVSLIDDIDGTPAVETVPFELDGVGYEVDLNEGNAGGLRDALRAYINAARKVGKSSKPRAGAPKSTSATADREQRTAIREWARANGIQMGDRGRISDLVKLAYDRRDPSLAQRAGSDPLTPVG